MDVVREPGAPDGAEIATDPTASAWCSATTAAPPEAEIAETPGIAQGTVKSSISRAMASMTEGLEGTR